MRDRPITGLRRSIRARVALAGAALLGLALLLSALTLSRLEHRSLIREIDAALAVRVTGVKETIVAGELDADVPVTGLESGVVQVLSLHHVLAATPGLHESPILDAIVARLAHISFKSVSRLTIPGDSGERWRVASLRVDTPTGVRDIFAASTLERVNSSIRRLEQILFAGVPMLTGAFAAIAWTMTGWALSPVDRLRRQVDEIEANDLDRSLDEPATGDEIASLAHTMNSLLGRLHDSRLRERRFAADASHELRTPLSTARLTLEIALTHPAQAEWTTVAQQTLDEVGRLEQLAKDLLQLTRLEPARVRASAEPIDLDQLVREEVQKRTALRPDVLFLVPMTAAPAVVRGLPNLVLRALRNLLDNAERHAEHRIEVRTISRDDVVELTIANDGPPIAAQDLVRIFEPFTRLDPDRGADDGGTGLGLAIVSDIARAHGGVVSAATPELGNGMHVAFTVTLPRG